MTKKFLMQNLYPACGGVLNFDNRSGGIIEFKVPSRAREYALNTHAVGGVLNFMVKFSS